MALFAVRVCLSRWAAGHFERGLRSGVTEVIGDEAGYDDGVASPA